MERLGYSMKLFTNREDKICCIDPPLDFCVSCTGVFWDYQCDDLLVGKIFMKNRQWVRY